MCQEIYLTIYARTRHEARTEREIERERERDLEKEKRPPVKLSNYVDKH